MLSVCRPEARTSGRFARNHGQEERDYYARGPPDQWPVEERLAGRSRCGRVRPCAGTPESTHWTESGGRPEVIIAGHVLRAMLSHYPSRPDPTSHRSKTH
jgi:hypothetical protein